jgi:hypothetical protein
MKPTRGNNSPQWTPPSPPPDALTSNCGLIEKALEPHHWLVARPSHWPDQQLRNVPLQIVARRKPDRVLHVLFFQRLVQLRLGKGRSGAEDYLLALRLLPLNLGQQQFLLALGTVDVAGP